MKNRQSGLDLLRCIALLFVILFHSFLYNGFYFQPQTGAAMLLADTVRWLSTSCIGIFLMLTGYLKSEEPVCLRYYRSLWRALLGYLLAAAVSIPVRHFLLNDPQSLSEWVRRLFSFSGVYYGWYVEMYIGLLLLSPIFNLALTGVKSKGQLFLLAGAMIIVTSGSGATELTFFPDYWNAMYPLTYYVLGAIIRRLQPRLKPWLALLSAAAISLALGTATLLSTDGTVSEAFTQKFGDLWIMLLSLCIFLGLYRIPIGAPMQKLLCWAAGSCYGGYLLSHLLDVWMYRLVPRWLEPGQYWKVFCCITLPVYLASLFAGWLLMQAVGFLLRILQRKTTARPGCTAK